MERAKHLKAQRRWQAVLEGALRLEAQQAKKPCSTCAFVDPESWVADAEMGDKLIACLDQPGTHRFFCHEGMPVQIGLDGEPGPYLPPLKEDGRIDERQLTPCGGFLRWARQWYAQPRAAQVQAVRALQLQMCRRYLAGDSPDAATFRQASGGQPRLLQQALNILSRQKRGDA